MHTFSVSWAALPLSLVALAVAGCSDNGGNDGTSPMGGSGSVAGSAGTSGAGGSVTSAGTGGQAGGGSGGAGGAGGSAGSAGMAGGGAGGGAMSTCVVPPGTDEPPTMLSQTGCIDMADPTKPAPGLVPYSVRSPLWSDAATKERFMSIPQGMKIHALDCAVDVNACKAPGDGGSGEDEGHFDMPVGTVLVKNFSIEGKHIETRLLMRRSMLTWAGFSYEWNDAQTEATLLPDDEVGKDKPVGAAQTQTWHYPSRAQCLLCHTKYAGRSLGPSTAQLNSDFAYADGTMNQIEKLKQLGLFDAPPKDIKGYPVPSDMAAATLEERARSYIQSNCAMCHRPGGEFATVDMRYPTTLANTKLCDVVERDMGKVPKYRLVPGDPAKSSMSFRIHALDALRMPKVGSSVVDPDGTQLIDDWITAMPTDACGPQP